MPVNGENDLDRSTNPVRGEERIDAVKRDAA